MNETETNQQTNSTIGLTWPGGSHSAHGVLLGTIRLGSGGRGIQSCDGLVEFAHVGFEVQLITGGRAVVLEAVEVSLACELPKKQWH